MGLDAEWALAGCMRGGMRGSGYPAGWLSEKRPCPVCEKPVAGRQVGMAEHMRAKHGLNRSSAMHEANAVWRRAAQWDRSGEADETRRGSAAGESPVDGEAGDAPDLLTPSNPEIPNG